MDARWVDGNGLTWRALGTCCAVLLLLPLMAAGGAKAEAAASMWSVSQGACDSPAAPDVMSAAVDLFVINDPDVHEIDKDPLPDDAEGVVYVQSYNQWREDYWPTRWQSMISNRPYVLDVMPYWKCVRVTQGRVRLDLTGLFNPDGVEGDFLLTLLAKDPDGERYAAQWTIEVNARRQDEVDYQRVYIYPTLEKWTQGRTRNVVPSGLGGDDPKDIQSFTLQFAPLLRSQALASPLIPTQRDRRPLVLVHGIHGNAGYFGELPNALRELGYDVWEFLYPNDQNIRFSGGLFGQALRVIQQFYDAPEVDIVAHSMGGLVTRAYMQGLGLLASDEGRHESADRAIPYQEDVAKWVSLATPHHGIVWAHHVVEGSPDRCVFRTELLRPIVGDIPFANDEPAIAQLAAGSEFLWRLNEAPLPEAPEPLADMLTVGVSGLGGILRPITFGCLSFDPKNDVAVDLLASSLLDQDVPGMVLEYDLGLFETGSVPHNMVREDIERVPQILRSFLEDGIVDYGLPGVIDPESGVRRELEFQAIYPGAEGIPVSKEVDADFAGAWVRMIPTASIDYIGSAALLGPDVATTTQPRVNVNDRETPTLAPGVPVYYLMTQAEYDPPPPLVAESPLETIGVAFLPDGARALDIQVEGIGRRTIPFEANEVQRLAVCSSQVPLDSSSIGFSLTQGGEGVLSAAWSDAPRPVWASVVYEADSEPRRTLTLPEEEPTRSVVLHDLTPGTDYAVTLTLHDPCQGPPVVKEFPLIQAPEEGPPSVSSTTVMVMDTSGSMAWDDPSGGSKIAAAIEAAEGLVRMIERENDVTGSDHRMGLIRFSSDASRLEGPTDDLAALRGSLRTLRSGGGTQMARGLSLAIEDSQDGEGEHFVTLLSDGAAGDKLEVRGLLPDLAQAADCVFTIGFGDPAASGGGTPGGFLGLFGVGQVAYDEELLREIADVTDCDGFYTAANAAELAHVYIQQRHEATGEITADDTGLLAQGETSTPVQFVVPRSAEELHVTLNWPGSAMDLLLVDPRGRQVDDRYASASISTGPPPTYAIVRDPLAGRWQVSAYGRDLPDGPEPYGIVSSVRAPRDLGGTGAAGWLVAGFAALLLGGWMVARGGPSGAVSDRRRVAAAPLILLIQEPDQAPRGVRVRTGPYRIGRGGEADLSLDDATVSRRHCVLEPGRDGRWRVVDSSSRTGTVRNGRRIRRGSIKAGDVIQLGRTRIEIRAVSPSPPAEAGSSAEWYIEGSE